MQHFFMMGVNDDDRKLMLKDLTRQKSRVVEVNGLIAPSWWNDDEEAAASSMAALGELTRR